MVNKPLLEKVRQRKYSNTSMVSREKKHTAYRHFEANYFMSRGGKIKLGFSLFAKGNFQREVQFYCRAPRTKAFLGETDFCKPIPAHLSSSPSPFFFFSSDFLQQRKGFLFNLRLWACSSLLSFGAGQPESARTMRSSFFWQG